MASTITAGNATNGLGVSSDNTGTLDIKTGTGSGTTAISVDASQVVTMPGNLVVTGTITAGAGTTYVLNQYTSPAAWDANTKKAAGLKAIKVTVVGAGGNGGPATGVAPGFGGGGGGGAGGASIYYVLAPSIPGPQAITAGPGTNSFGALASATAGSNASAAPNTSTSGAAGGTGSGGTINFSGGGGGAGTAGASAAGTIGGAGGGSIFGGGAQGRVNAGSGFSTTSYGGGGGGAAAASSPTVQPGGSGGPGIVIVEEFY